MLILSQYSGSTSVRQQPGVFVFLLGLVFATSELELTLNSCLPGKPCTKGAILASAEIPSPHIPNSQGLAKVKLSSVAWTCPPQPKGNIVI